MEPKIFIRFSENKITILKIGMCKFSDFESNIIKGIDDLFKKLVEIKSENVKVSSVSYELLVEVE